MRSAFGLLPAVTVLQYEASPSEYDPGAEQKMQILAAFSEYFPASHVAQDVADLLYLPAVQNSHLAAPAAVETDPIGQTLHSLAPPSLNVPAAQFEHKLFAVAVHCFAKNLPGEQSVQLWQVEACEYCWKFSPLSQGFFSPPTQK